VWVRLVSVYTDAGLDSFLDYSLNNTIAASILRTFLVERVDFILLPSNLYPRDITGPDSPGERIPSYSSRLPLTLSLSMVMSFFGLA